MSQHLDRKKLPKGVRLGWTDMKDVKHVVLTSDVVKGVRVSAKDSGNRRDHGTNRNYLIP